MVAAGLKQLPAPPAVLICVLRRLPLFAVLLLAVAVPAPAEAAITLRDTGLRGTVVRTDGERRLAVSSSTIAAPVTIVEAKSGAQRTLPAPPNCTFADIGRDALLWSCGVSPYRSGLTMDLQSGQPGALPEIGARASVVGGESSVYVAVGTRWARGLLNGYRTSIPIYVDRLTGAMRTFPNRRRDDVPDLDAPGLVVRLCAGQRRPLVADASGVLAAPGPLVRAGSIAAATTLPDRGDGPPRVQLQRCRRTARTLRRCLRIVCSDPVIVRGWIVWSETVYGYRARGRLVAYDSASRRMIRSAVRPAELIPVAVGRRLYVQQGQQVFRAGLGTSRGRVG